MWYHPGSITASKYDIHIYKDSFRHLCLKQQTNTTPVLFLTFTLSVVHLIHGL